MQTNVSLPVDPAAALYQGKSYHAQERSPLLDWFRFEDRRVLDVGCGTGEYARELRKQGVEVHGVTLSDAEREKAFGVMKRTVIANVETWTPDYPDGFFDALLMSHVLEHLVDPLTALQKLSALLRPGGRVYIALPNIAFWRYRFRVLLGKFDYEETGPMDRSHLRFFTYRSARALVEESGFDVLRTEVRGHLPLGAFRRRFPNLSRRLDRLALRYFPGLFGYEIYLSGSKSALA